MSSKTILFAFALIICFSNNSTAQTKTTRELKKAEEVVDKGVKLSKLFKKKDKKKAESQSEVSKDSESNSTIESPEIEVNEESSVSDITPVSATTFDEVQLTRDAELLFKNVISKTTNTDKNEITTHMNIKASSDGTKFHINDQYSLDFLFKPEVFPVDFNYDGVEEVVIVYSHPAISGDNVISTLFIKDNQEHYNLNFSYTGSLILLPNTTKDFQDLAIGGPGFEFPVRRWNGKTYDYNRQITDDQLLAANPLFIEEASKLYTDSIKN